MPDIKLVDEPRRQRGVKTAVQVRSVLLRMSEQHVDNLDILCKVNARSRREIVEILIAEAALELSQDSEARITPI